MTTMSLRDARVSPRQRLPRVLAPSVVGHAGPVVRVQLTVRYVRCAPAAEDTELNL